MNLRLQGIAVILTFFTAVAASDSFAAGRMYSAKGSSHGILTDEPVWSAGIQLGNHGATGFCGQRYGIYGGAVSVAAGLAYGTVSVSGDYLILFNSSFKKLKLAKSASFNDYRGKLQPYAGGGIQLADGFSLRVPAGVQYTMLKDPFNFFGGIAVLFGQFLDKTDGASLELWYNIGARVLL